MIKRVVFGGLFFALLCGIFCQGYAQEHPSTEKKRILVGSPVRQPPKILREFLDSLERLEQTNCTLDFFFVDDNTDETARSLLHEFAQKKGRKCHIEKAFIKDSGSSYRVTEGKHHWKFESVCRVGAFKNKIIEDAIQERYDYLFLIDSDLVLHPHTIEQLLCAKKEIISNVYWTKWRPGLAPLPQVWLYDEYIKYDHVIGEQLSEAEKERRTHAFLDMLKEPGIYEVGGLGACTLISRAVLEKDVSFKRIKNITMFGEDPHFCVRAVVQGFSLFVDTHFPAYHIYRESELSGVKAFLEKCDVVLAPKPQKKSRITLSMIVRNEEHNYLRRVLKAAREYVTDAVIIDDASTDKTVKVCREVLKGIPLKIVQNKESKFANEHVLRKQQWEETVKTNPEWILGIDADQIFEDKFKDEVQALCSDAFVDSYYFRQYDFWDENHYRDDGKWRAHKFYFPFMIRYKPGVEYRWKETPQHCGTFPHTIARFSRKNSELRLKHFGWAKPEDRRAKYHRYQKLDPGAKYGCQEQYDSILDEAPSLVSWEE